MSLFTHSATTEWDACFIPDTELGSKGSMLKTTDPIAFTAFSRAAPLINHILKKRKKYTYLYYRPQGECTFKWLVKIVIGVSFVGRLSDSQFNL